MIYYVFTGLVGMDGTMVKTEQGLVMSSNLVLIFFFALYRKLKVLKDLVNIFSNEISSLRMIPVKTKILAIQLR